MLIFSTETAEILVSMLQGSPRPAVTPGTKQHGLANKRLDDDAEGFDDPDTEECRTQALQLEAMDEQIEQQERDLQALMAALERKELQMQEFFGQTCARTQLNKNAPTNPCIICSKKYKTLFGEC